jgi:hypothetical protein
LGHDRLGRLPRTKAWQQVVDLIGSDVNVAQLAAATLNASRAGLEEAANDRGLVFSVWLLTQLPLAARERDFAAALRRIGVKVSDQPDVFELVAGFTEAVDSHLLRRGGRSDLGELAQLAAAELLAAVAGRRSNTLFGITPASVREGIRGLASGTQFAAFGHEFFSRFLHRYLSSYISREMSNHIGTGRRL